MGINSALSTGLSGLAANQTQLNVVGNNIANVNTVGYKDQSVNFQTLFSQSFSYGTAPQSPDGGTNPFQIGNGTTQASIERNFGAGSQEVTGVNTDLSIQGDGFFILHDSQQFYSRDGAFKLNSASQLVNGDGLFVQGFGVDSNFNIVPGVLGNLTVPVGQLTVANATSNATFDGNLNSGGVVATTATDSTLNQPFYLAGSGGVSSTAPTSGDLLTNLTNASNTPYFQTGDVITLTGTQDGRSIASKTFTVGSASTLGDLESFMTGALGINTTAGINGSAATPGVTATTSGNNVTLDVTGNTGSANDLELNANSITIARGGSTLTPFSFTQNATANGESVYTSMQAYDSLGNTVQVNLTATLASSSPSGTSWTFLATSPGTTSTGAATNTNIGQGTLTFNNFGQLTSSTGTSSTIDRTGTGASPTLAFDLDLSKVTALSGSTSNLASTNQDGSAQGTLTNFSIGNNGIINGSFSNGLTRNLGQIAIATFSNDQGLIDQGKNNFTPGPNSGTPVVTAPGTASAGTIAAGALELSNVDLSSEFVNMISASTGFSAASRIITTSNQMLQELLAAAR